MKTSEATASGHRLLSWFLFSRVLVISLFLGGAILYHLRSGLDRPQLAIHYLYLLVGISYVQALFSAVVLLRLRRARFFVQTQIVWDLLFATFLIYLTGGAESPFAFLFILIVISAAVFLRRREILFVAAAAAILYGSLIDLQYYGYLPRFSGLPFQQPVVAREIFYSVFVNVLAFLLTAFLCATLAGRLRRSEEALEKKAIDYEELESLNRTILASIGSGLMIINSNGRIRSFNQAAERITGFALEEAYDRDVRELFPGLTVYDGSFRVVERGEGHFVSQGGGRGVLGYASSTITGSDGKVIGLLVTFQDLTRLKGMEDRLKRADRMAAVGQLASGMAHEIRNPLASISGSVQLLMEGGPATEEDRRLMLIVIKEADRLSNLLTDFLLYASPATPCIAEVNVSSLLDELADIVAADPRFGDVEIRRDYPPGVTMTLDRQKLCQALWNLCINSAEAMANQGVLTLGLKTASGEIYVEDQGPGIPEHIREQVFNPFFTTKDRGTGLGLATVHKIVEAHGGSVRVTPGQNGGTRIVIQLNERSS